MTDDGLMADWVALSVKEGVVVRPGDTLVVKIDPENVFPDQIASMNEEIGQIADYFERLMPPGCRCAVIAMNGELGVVRADPDSAPKPLLRPEIPPGEAP